MLIEIRRLKLNLGTHAILRDVNLTLRKGQIYGLLGPNGAGKSTTISVVTGLRASTAGSVRVFGLGPVTDTQPITMQITRFVITLLWLMLTAVFAIRSVRKIEI